MPTAKRDRSLSLTTRQVSELSRVPRSTLDSWVKIGLVRASLLGSSGKRSDRYWSVRDLVTVRTVKAMRDAGCPMQQLRKASALLTRLGDGFADQVVMWDGNDVIATDQWGDVQSLVREPGQGMLHLLAMPLAEWAKDAERNAELRDIEAIRHRRDQRRVG